MPPSGFNQKAVKGALQFIQGCYEDLEAEVKSGKHPDFRTALEYEIHQLDSALTKLHINSAGELVER
jgi:tetrahydromethanopterin S-methyltransferase subunit E